MGMPVPADKLPTHLRGAVPADKLPAHLQTPAAAPVETPAAGGAGPAASYPLSSVGIDQPADIPGVGLLVNAGEGLWNAGAKAASGYAGLLGTVLPGPEGQGADWQKRTNDTLHTGLTPNKDPLVNLPAQAVNSGAGLLDQTPVGQGFNNFVENTPGVKDTLEGGMDIATLLGVAQPLNAARAGVAADRSAIASPERLLGNRKGAPVPGTAVAGPGDNTYLNSPAANVSRAGIDVTPGEVGKQVAGSGEKVTGAKRAGFGTGAVNKETAMGNAPRINEIGVRGMPEGVQLDTRNGRIELGDPRAPAPGTINAAKRVEGAKYDAVRQVPGAGSSPDLVRSLHDIAQGLENVPESVARDVQRIAASKAGGGTSTKLVDDIMELRQEAVMDGRRAFNQNDPTARQLAGYKRRVSDALEEELARRGEAAGLQGVRETLQEARVNFAKLSTLEEAWDQGFIDSARLEKVTEGGGYLSDGLKDLSDYNNAAPISMTHPQRVGPQAEPNMRAGASPTDMALRSAQFIGGNWLTKQIGKGGVNALNEELRSFQPAPRPPAMEPPTFDFERAPEPMGPPFPTGAQSSVAPPAPNSAPLGPFDLQGARFADGLNLELVDPMTGQVPGAGLRDFAQAPDTIPFDPAPPAGPVSPAARGSIADELGPTRGQPDIPRGPAMPNKPRGVTGPRSASLKDPQLSDDLVVGDQPPPRTPDFGPDDEFSDVLSLAPDNGPPRSRVDVTEDLPSQGTEKFPDRYKRPQAKRVETDDGYIAYVDEGKRWKLDDAFVRETARGKGKGQEQLVDVARKAQDAGKQLDSDVKVSPDQRRVYAKLKDKGQLEFDGPFDEGSVFRNIRPAGGDFAAGLVE